MKRQTYIVKVWCNAPTWIDANPEDRDFYRVGCKKVETAIRYLKGWVKQSEGYKSLYRYFFGKDARYEIIATPNGYDGDEIAASGLICQL